MFTNSLPIVFLTKLAILTCEKNERKVMSDNFTSIVSEAFNPSIFCGATLLVYSL